MHEPTAAEIIAIAEKHGLRIGADWGLYDLDERGVVVSATPFGLLLIDRANDPDLLPPHSPKWPDIAKALQVSIPWLAGLFQGFEGLDDDTNYKDHDLKAFGRGYAVGTLVRLHAMEVVDVRALR
ncbi:hypothetical protein [Nitrolancea hollandica]|uniref:Uncharacterized protein n=1 Tax=Nitrolancea hollandica Lb TaxID=1129897 RepID=I4EL31_9BACT|nr:hypothetical protein [Nitrolancea hollandica]CCF85393.1 hypothetical protein NITHO_4920004 [Nitrolancea hollandica Lb]